MTSRVNPARGHMLTLGVGLATNPEKLLPAQAHGEVLFMVAARVSRAVGLPDFRGLMLDIYEQLDAPAHKILSGLPATACKPCSVDFGAEGMRRKQTSDTRVPRVFAVEPKILDRQR